MSSAEVAEQTRTKERLMQAGERLFARDGIHAARIRELNELAGQRNPSALHYHFGSREGLVTAILYRHQADVDAALEPTLDELEAQGRTGDLRAVVEAIVRPMAAKLDEPSGRDWARIVPQRLQALSRSLREGTIGYVTPATARFLGLLEQGMGHLPEAVRRERITDYGLVVTTLLAERAHHLESGHSPGLDAEAFVANTVDVLVAVLTAPSTLG